PEKSGRRGGSSAAVRGSRVVGEGVADQGVAPAGLCAVEAEDVEAAGAIVPAARREVEGGGAGEPPLLGESHRLDGQAVAVAGAGLDLDETEGLPLARHDVDLAAAVGDVAG